jgi:hypothetical protein
MAAFSVMPHAKNIRKPADLWKFPWEATPSPLKRGDVTPARTKEDVKRRIEELKARWK